VRTFLILFTAGTLGLSAFAAWLFFGGPEDDPTRIKLAAYVARIEAVKPQAESGDVGAAYELGRLYHKGEYGARDYGEAFKWYSKAAARGHTQAQVGLASLYADGKGVTQDYFRAAEWYRAAANLGRSADAQAALGDLHFHGRGVAHDIAEARDWYRKAAERGHALGQYRLGWMMQEGYAGRLDPVEAYTWLTLAARHADKVRASDPDADAEAALARLAKNMTDDQLARGADAVRNFQAKK
jgi:uncharacterized protein